MAGRFSTLSPKVRDAIVAEVDLGAPFHYAYLLAGVHKPTGEKWRTKGHHAIRDGTEDEYSELVNLMDQAKARYLKTIWMRMTNAGNNPAFWQSDSELLARRCPESFSKNAGVEGNYQDQSMTIDEQSAQVVRDINSGAITSEEGLRRAQTIQLLAQAKYDSLMEPLREKLIPILKQMEGK